MTYPLSLERISRKQSNVFIPLARGENLPRRRRLFSRLLVIGQTSHQSA